jgi:formylglycine-generating enzyme required for sulfatase activity
MDDAYRDDQDPFNDAAKVAALENADLVIVSRRTGSGYYDDNRTGWNTLGTPLLVMSGYLTRGGSDDRWHWTPGGSDNADNTVTDIDIQAGQEDHPFLTGLTGPVTAFDWLTSPGGVCPKGVYLPGDDFVAGAILIGRFDGRPMLADIPAGTTLNNGNVTGERRAFLGHWGYDTDDDGPGGTYSEFEHYITDDYKTLLTNVINEMLNEMLADFLLVVVGDMNADLTVDFADFAVIANNWLSDALNPEYPIQPPGPEIIRLTNNSHDDREPRISGCRVVWHGWDGHDNEIFLYDGAKTTQLTDNSYDDINPEISGDDIVWQGSDGSDFEIFYYRNGQVTQITNNNYYDISAQISGEDIVWQGLEGLDSEIFAYSLRWDEVDSPIQVTDNGYLDANPKIWEGIIVWEMHDGSDYEIMISGISDISEPLDVAQLTDNDYDDRPPQVSGALNYFDVVWQGWDGEDYEIFLSDGMSSWIVSRITDNDYDDVSPQVSSPPITWCALRPSGSAVLMDDNTETKLDIPTNSGTDNKPQFSEYSIVWEDWDGQDKEIFLYRNGKTIQLTDNSLEDSNPKISGHYVTWETQDGHDYEIYMAKLRTIVAHWRLDIETEGNDSAGRNDGELSGPASWQSDTGRVSGALEFDGEPYTHLDCGNSEELDLTDQITVAAWVKTKDSGNSEHNPYVTKGSYSFGLKHRSNNVIEFFIYDDNIWDWRSASVAVDNSFNSAWHHLVGTYDRTEIKLYIDGRLRATTPHIGTIAYTDYPLYIGGNSYRPDRAYEGLIDDVRIYNYALTAEEVESLSSMRGRPLAGDTNADSRVDFADIAAMADNWLRRGATDPNEGMVLIPGGEFQMGNSFGLNDAGGVGGMDALPVHTVALNSFYMGKYEVTNQQYVEFLNDAFWNNLIEVQFGAIVYKKTTDYVYCLTSAQTISYPIAFTGSEFVVTASEKANHPAVHVTWYGAAAYCNWLSEQFGGERCYNPTDFTSDLSKHGYRLPTEAEWEYAARGGHAGRRFPWGDTISHSQANYYSTSNIFYDISPTRGYHPTWNDGIKPYTAPVGSFQANGYGLYDMTGNIFEWCNDWFSDSYYSSSPYYNPPGPMGRSDRVFRGGSWALGAPFCPSATRIWCPPNIGGYDLGFRIVLDSE